MGTQRAGEVKVCTSAKNKHLDVLTRYTKLSSKPLANQRQDFLQEAAAWAPPAGTEFSQLPGQWFPKGCCSDGINHHPLGVRLTRGLNSQNS